MLSSFFDSTNHDRLYSSADFAAYFKQFIGNGVFYNPSSSLQVAADSGLTVKVNVGSCFINGYCGRAIVAETVTLSEGSAADRYDLITARLDFISRDIHIEVIEGDAAEAAAYPELVRNASFYDIALAAVKVAKNAISISQADITDTRFDTALCGIVTGVVDTIDTSELFAQYQAAWDLLMQSFSGDEQAIIAAYDNLNRIRPLEIGGTNLITNSLFNAQTGWGCADSTTLIMTDNVAKVTPSSKSGTGIYATIVKIYGDTAADYVFSFTAKADGTRKIVVALTGFTADGTAVYRSTYTSLSITTDWQRFKAVFKCDKSNVVKFSLSIMSTPSDTTPFYIKYPKLERGTEATDWTPSPYDVPACIQRGTVTTSIPNGTATSGTATVTFPQAYRVVPNIQLTAHAGGAKYGVIATLVSATATGFTVRTNETTNSFISAAVDWVAIGERGTTLSTATVTITSQPQDMSAANGASATCSVAAEGTNLSYQWLFSADGGATWRVSSGKTAQYTVIAQTQYNGYLYRCRVTNGAGVSVLSDAATLTVTD